MTETTTDISIEASISWGWGAFRKNAELVIAIEVAVVVTAVVMRVVSDGSRIHGWFFGFAMSIAYFVVTMLVHLGAAKVALKLRDGQPVEFANMFDSFAILPAFMAAAVLTHLAVTTGLMFLVIPGIVVAVRFGLFGFLVVDETLGPIEAIQRSIQLTRGAGLDLFFFGMLCAGINLLGLMALGIGVFVSIPVTVLAAAHVYRTLNPRPVSDASP